MNSYSRYRHDVKDKYLESVVIIKKKAKTNPKPKTGGKQKLTYVTTLNERKNHHYCFFFSLLFSDFLLQNVFFFVWHSWRMFKEFVLHPAQFT